MLSSQVDEYPVTPDRRFSSSGVVRSGFRDFVRDIKRKSLSRKKLGLNFESLCPLTPNYKLESNENNKTVNSKISQGREFRTHSLVESE